MPVENLDQLTQQLIDSLIHQSDNLYNQQDKEKKAFDHFLKEAFEISRSTQNKEVQFNIYMKVGTRLRNAAQYSDALEILQKAQVLANELDNDRDRAYATHEMAVVFRRIDDNARALKFHIQALEWAESAKDTFLIHCSLNGVGDVYFDYQDYEQAIAYFHRSLLFVGGKVPNLLGEAINTNLLGESWLFMGNADSALIYLNQSFQINQKIGNELGQAICNNGMGLVYHEKGDYLQAVEYYNKALELYVQTGDLFYQSMCLNNLGKSQVALHRYTDAEKTFLKSLHIATTIGSKNFVLDAALELASLYNQIKMNESSFLYHQMALAYKDSITNDLKTQNMEAMDVLYKAEKQEREILILKQDAELAQLKMSRQKYFILSIAVLLFIVILIAFSIIRQRRLRSKLNEMQLEQKLFRAQLNPHFIFNSLAAVQNFIMKNDKTAASEYLVNFSRLMRNILMGSGTDFILLENEIEILDDYLKLQQVRFQNKFDYYFELADAIDPQVCLVPPMLLQPFIENAIEHGVRDIEQQGIIITRFEREGAYLIIEVEDNGHGLQEQNEKNKKKAHISMATQITHQRMQNLQSITRKNCRLEVIDKASVGRLPGVLIRIEVPYQEEN